jgi:signal transduction histidine kinase
MSPRSLRVRLGCAAALLIALALALGGIGLTAIFDEQAERRAATELDLHLKTLAAQVRIDATGALRIDVPPQEPRFEQPYGGLYWQVDGPEGARLRSRSLWDFLLHDPPGTSLRRDLDMHDMPGPESAELLAIQRTIVVTQGATERAVQITVAIDEALLSAERWSFLGLLVPSLVALAVVLGLAMAFFIHLALRPFRALRADLADIHAGRRRTLSRDVPDEVQPVVDDLNRLIGFQDAAVERARTQSADLAHGLKTPLAVLGAMARTARNDGEIRLAADIDEQIDAMRRHVDRALARARAGMAAALGQQSADISTVCRKTLRMLKTLPDAGALIWTSDVPDGLRFAGDEGDLTELLANLLDNARKWAASQVRLTAHAQGKQVIVVIEDDGPGMSEEEAAHIDRGQRWDESTPGTGFGLAITRDLVDAYHGRVKLDRSDLGGLRVVLELPSPRVATK